MSVLQESFITLIYDLFVNYTHISLAKPMLNDPIIPIIPFQVTKSTVTSEVVVETKSTPQQTPQQTPQLTLKHLNDRIEQLEQLVEKQKKT